MIDRIDKQTAKVLAAQAEELLAPLAEQNVHAHVDASKVRYNSRMVEIRVTLSLPTEDGIVESPDARTLRLRGGAYGFKPEDVGAVFKHQVRGEMRTFEITGLVPRRRKYPVSTKCIETGCAMKFPAQAVLRALGREHSNAWGG